MYIAKRINLITYSVSTAGAPHIHPFNWLVAKKAQAYTSSATLACAPGSIFWVVAGSIGL
jgi:hypothetical protein